MPCVESILIELREAIGTNSLHISCLPSQTPPHLWDFRTSADRGGSLQDLRVLEDEEYVYRVETRTMGAITTDKPELFVADYHDGRTGRFRPGLNVGELQIRFFVGGVPCGSASFEVLSKKISYLSDYQAMLKSIASYLAEIIAERFAPSEQDFSPLENRDAVTLYQQFAFLRSFLLSDEFQAAVRQIISTPDQHWTASDEQRPLSKGLRSTVGIMRALSCPGQRQANPGIGIDCLTLPLFVPGLTFIEDVDTPENRFVFHILQNWLALAILVRDRIRAGQSAREQRGIREAEEVIAALEQVLAANLFRKLGVLGFVPVGSTVLQRKEGYRELYRVFLQAQVAAQISWQGADDVYGAGKKNVALLYEYWVFLTLASIVSKLCGLKPLNVSSLIEKTPDGLGLKLRQDKRFALRGYAERNGKKMAITLFYNRSFKPSSNLNEGSWTREMAPDFSVRITEIAIPEHSAWLHFDAKYKVDTILELFGPAPEDKSGQARGEKSKVTPIGYKREDLLKMHAYKDAVRRSSGAFILYPGTENTIFRQFTEIVPGIGAFALRPTEMGPEGAPQVEQFLSDVISSFAAT